MKHYRVWITKGPGKESYKMFEDMQELAQWFCTEDKPLGGWGIEKYSDNTWVDAFFCDDLIALMWAMRDILLKM